MREHEAVELGTTIAGRYRVVSEIGRGGMGVVYRVEHVHTGEALALKLLIGLARTDPQAVARFKREARAATQLKSEHVVRVSDADTAPELDGSPFFVMELLDGIDLEQLVSAQGPVAPASLVVLLGQIGNVLQSAHDQGIVHRDLKPGNLFLHRRADGSTVAKVLDFGISKFMTREQQLETANKTSTGSVLGTPLYMAPEQAHGQNDKIAPTTDVWALGLLTMRLLTGEHYWGEPTMAELMMKIAVKDIVPPSERWPDRPEMTAALDAWFLRSCARDQAKRFGSVAEQMKELAAALGEELPAESRDTNIRIDPNARFAKPSPLFSQATDGDALAPTELDRKSEQSPAAMSASTPAKSPLALSNTPSAVSRSIAKAADPEPASTANPRRSRGLVIGGTVAAAAVVVLAVAANGQRAPAPASAPSVTSEPSLVPAASTMPSTERGVASATPAWPSVSASASSSAVAAPPIAAAPKPAARPKPSATPTVSATTPVASATGQFNPVAP